MQMIRRFSVALIVLCGMIVGPALANGSTNEKPAGQVVTQTQTLHTVAEGETLAGIAGQFYLTERQLRFHNLLPDPDEVTPGQQLRIPEPTLRVPADWQREYAEGRLPGQEFPLHVVSRGETLSLIARSYGLEVAQLLEMNDIENPSLVEVGDQLRLPFGAEQQQPVAALRWPAVNKVTRDTPLGLYIVARGDSLWQIAERFGVKADQIQAANTLPDPNVLEIGDRLLVPDPNGLLPPASPPSEYTFMWPLDDYEIVSEFGGRGDREHRGVDMAARAGAPVRASAAGTVIFSGEQQGYGNVVILEHDDGVETLYAHNTRNLVKRGQEVLQGQTIATVGDTGNAKGSHVHFEYIVDGDRKEPRDYIEGTLRNKS